MPAKKKARPKLREQLAGATLVIADQLRAIQKLTDERARNRREDQAEIAYWKGEVERLHNDLLEIHRERARAGAIEEP